MLKQKQFTNQQIKILMCHSCSVQQFENKEYQNHHQRIGILGYCPSFNL